MTTKNKKPLKKILKHHAKHLLVPHKGNHYHPHLIRTGGIFGILAFIIIAQVAYHVITTGNFAVLGRTTTTSIDGLVADTNVARQQNGLPALTENATLNQAAYEKAQDMIANNYWAHVSPTGVQPWSWLSAVGYNYDSAGENLAKNYDSSQDTVNAWLASPTHRANIMNKDYTQVGFAVIEGQLQGKDTSLVVAYYAKPAVTSVLGISSAIPSPSASFSQPKTGALNPLTYLGTTIQTLNPATLGSLVVLVIASAVALVTYHYRRKLPKRLQNTWKVHHGAYKAAGFVVVAIILISLTASSGQI